MFVGVKRESVGSSCGCHQERGGLWVKANLPEGSLIIGLLACPEVRARLSQIRFQSFNLGVARRERDGLSPSFTIHIQLPLCLMLLPYHGGNGLHQGHA